MSALACIALAAWFGGALVTARWAMETMRRLDAVSWTIDQKVSTTLLVLMMVALWPVTWGVALTRERS